MVLDTTVLIDLLRGDPAAAAWTLTWSEPPVCSEMTRVEVLRGLRAAERERTEALFRDLEWVAVTTPIARLAGELEYTWRRSRRPTLGTVDLVVAATAQSVGLPLATANVRDFPMFAGLQAPY